tara:strand:+ start:404 stop:751 length:348 start_codon:yes stop_codon:yes gene_type:complete
MELDKVKVRKLKQTLQAVHKELGDMPLMQLTVLLAAAEADLYKENTDSKTIAKDLNISASSTSRHLSQYTDWTWLKRPGVEFVEQRKDRVDGRRRFIHITNKGNKFIAKITKLLD